MPVHQVREVGVGDLDALGAAGTARGVDHVGQALPLGDRVLCRQRRPRDRRGGCRARVVVESELDPRPGRHRRRAGAVAQHDRCTGITEDVVDPIGRRRGIERQVGRPRAQDRVGGDDEPGGAREEESYAAPRACTGGPEGSRESAGPLGELPVRQGHLRVRDGETVRCVRGMGFDAGGHGHEGHGGGGTAGEGGGPDDRPGHRVGTCAPHPPSAGRPGLWLVISRSDRLRAETPWRSSVEVARRDTVSCGPHRRGGVNGRHHHI